MAITFRCAECSETYEVEDELSGKTIRCRECRGWNRVPSLPVPKKKTAPALAPLMRKPRSSSLTFMKGLLTGAVLMGLASGAGLWLGLAFHKAEPPLQKVEDSNAQSKSDASESEKLKKRQEISDLYKRWQLGCESALKAQSEFKDCERNLKKQMDEMENMKGIAEADLGAFAEALQAQLDLLNTSRKGLENAQQHLLLAEETLKGIEEESQRRFGIAPDSLPRLLSP